MELPWTSDPITLCRERSNEAAGMSGTSWSAATTVIGAAFFASLVEFVEAFTIILAVGIVDGWRSALLGSLAGFVLLVAAVVTLGPLLETIPLPMLQLVIGTLLLMFGMRWLRKAILRAAGIIPLHDEQLAFHAETALLRAGAPVGKPLIRVGSIAAFKAVVLEGVEVVFIVLALGAGHDLIWPASLGAAIACALVLVIGLFLHRPLSRVPENTLKFGVGVLLSAFGVFWTAEGLGFEWPGGDIAIIALAGLLLLMSLLTVRLTKKSSKGENPNEPSG